MAQVKLKRLPPHERRALIQEAAAHLFSQRGYAATTLDEVAAAAGVTKPVLYRHFESKKALHLALLTKHRDELLACVSKRADPEISLEAQLPAILDAWFSYVEEHPFAWRMLFRDTTDDPDIKDFHEELHASARSFTVALIEARPESIVPAREVEPLAEAIRAATTGVALWWLKHSDLPRSVPVDVMLRIIGGLIATGR